MNKFFFPLILIILAAGLFFGLTSPLMEEVRALDAQANTLNSALTNGKELQVVRDSLLSKFKNFSEEDRTRLDKVLPNSVDNVRLIIDIDNIASRFGMTLRNVRLNSNKDATATSVGPTGKRYATLGLTFTVSSSYENIKRFIADLERNLRISDVTGVTFTSGDKDQGDYTIDLTTYWYKL